MRFEFYKQCSVSLVCVIMSVMGYGDSVPDISVLNSQMQSVSIGKSSVLNKTDESLLLEYNECVYEYDLSNSKIVRQNCSPATAVIKSQNHLDFDLSPNVVNSGVERRHRIYIKKVSSEHRSGYFISDPLDSDSYYQYKTNPNRRGVLRVAFHCVVYPSGDVQLYAADEGVLCR